MSAATKTGASYTYDYDRYGNRWHQNGPLAFAASFSSGNNRQDPSNGSSYDAAGNMTNDGLGHSFIYDAENRIIQVGTTTYVYDGGGRRVRKTANGWSFDFFYDLGNHEVAEMSQDGGWTRGEIFAADRHIATYNSGTTFFNHVDWLATERVRTGMSGVVSETCLSLPFGDGQSCSGSDTSPNHFTGKKRDSESGNDYFGARYYSSTLGRWLTPDWSAVPSAVPYASLVNPQTLGLYTYVRNNATSSVDADGHLVLLRGNSERRREAERRLRATLNANEQKYFRVVRNNRTGKVELRYTGGTAATRGEHSTAFGKLVETIKDTHTASVSVSSTYVDPSTHAVKNVGTDAGGGVTLVHAQPDGKANVEVILAPNGNPYVTRGLVNEAVPDPPEIIAGHELLGHGLAAMEGADHSQRVAIETENELRMDKGLPVRQLDPQPH